VIADALNKLFGIAERAVKAEETAKLSFKEIPLGLGKRRLMFADGSHEVIQKRVHDVSNVRLDHFPARVKELAKEGKNYVAFVNTVRSYCRIEDDSVVSPVFADHDHSSQLKYLNLGLEAKGWMSPTEVVSEFSLNLQDCFNSQSDFKSFVKCFRSIAAERKRTQSSGAANATYGASVTQDLKSTDGSLDQWEYITLKVKCVEADFIQPENIRLVMSSDPETLRFSFDVVDGDIDRAMERTASQIIDWMRLQFADPLFTNGTVSVVCGTQTTGYEAVE
jgi:hypothetical protein